MILVSRGQDTPSSDSTERFLYSNPSILYPWLRQVREIPGEIAIEESRRTITHRELHAIVCNIAHWISQQHEPPNCNPVVAVVGSRSIDTICAWLGTLYAGYAFSFVDQQAPPRAVPASLELLNPRALIYSGETRDSFAKDFSEASREKREIPVLRMAGLNDASIPSSQLSPPAPVRDPAKIAYVLFSSGTTGSPKGVCIGHDTASQAIRAFIEDLAVGPKDCVGASVSFSFDVSVFDIFSALWTGARLKIIPFDAGTSLERRASRMAKSGATLFFTVPSLAIAMARIAQREQDLRFLRLIAMTGELLTVQLRDELEDLLPENVEIRNLYGGTEIPYVLSAHVNKNRRIDPNVFDPIESKIPIRYQTTPSSSMELDGEPEELLVPRELALAGYLDSSEHWPVPREHPMFYGTGDLFRWRQGRTIAFAGRKDRQVRIHGYRVELEAIESWVIKHPDVENCAAFFLQAQQCILLVIEPRNKNKGKKSISCSLMNHCHMGLPPYMSPGRIEFVNRIPRTHSGKINRVEIMKIFQLDGNRSDPPPVRSGVIQLSCGTEFL